MREQLSVAHQRVESMPRSHRALRVWLRLLSSATLIEKELRARFRSEFATTLPRFDVMAALDRHPNGLGMSDLSRWLMVSNGNVTGIVARLADEGLVERDRMDDDRRAVTVRLTPAGTREFARQSRAHERWIRDLLGALSTAEMDQLQRLLAKTKRSAAVQ